MWAIYPYMITIDTVFNTEGNDLDDFSRIITSLERDVELKITANKLMGEHTYHDKTPIANMVGYF